MIAKKKCTSHASWEIVYDSEDRLLTWCFHVPLLSSASARGNIPSMLLHESMFMHSVFTQTSEAQMVQWTSAAQEHTILGTYAQTEMGHGRYSAVNNQSIAVWQSDCQLHVPYQLTDQPVTVLTLVKFVKPSKILMDLRNVLLSVCVWWNLQSSLSVVVGIVSVENCGHFNDDQCLHIWHMKSLRYTLRKCRIQTASTKGGTTLYARHTRRLCHAHHFGWQIGLRLNAASPKIRTLLNKRTVTLPTSMVHPRLFNDDVRWIGSIVGQTTALDKKESWARIWRKVCLYLWFFTELGGKY